MAWGTKNPPKRKGRYLVTLKTPFGNQVRQAERYEYPKDKWYGKRQRSCCMAKMSRTI